MNESTIIMLVILALYLLANQSEKVRILQTKSNPSNIMIKLFMVSALIIFIANSLMVILKNSSSGTISLIFGAVALGTLHPVVKNQVYPKLHLNPKNNVHILSITLAILLIWQFTSILNIGLGALKEQILTSTTESAILNIWSQNLLHFSLAIVGVGFLTRRTLLQSLDRLGIKKISIELWLGFLSLGITFALIGSLVANTLPSDPVVEELTKKSIGPLFGSSLGVISIGLAAALGEEAIFRGALQPKIGILLTSLLFTITHTTYGLSSSTLVVFILALALGNIRKRYSTTSSMIVHATYNIGIAVISICFSKWG